ncbi:MAG: putative sulfate exporter family transporter, partial [bacterium]|nr:putative sulfate exporter family transporter [bacterium]
MEATKPRVNEDWLAVYIGGFILLLALALLFGGDLLGWAAKSTEWINITKSVSTVSKAYSGLGGVGAVLVTYLFLLGLMALGARALGANVKKFAAGFTAIFFLAFLCRIAGAWAYIAATPNKRADFDIDWSLSLTAEAGYIIALLLGLVIGNFTPGVAEKLKEALRPELYVKTAIVILGGTVGVKAAEQLGLASSVMFRGLCAIIEAYLIYWAVVY